MAVQASPKQPPDLRQFAAPFRVCFPRQVATVRNLVYAVLPQFAVKPAEAAWIDEQVWIKLQSIISIQLGVPVEQVTPEAYLTNDLGCD